jgi:hypothetical protein
MKLSNHIISPVQLEQRTTNRLGSTFQITEGALRSMITQNGMDIRIVNHWLIQVCQYVLFFKQPALKDFGVADGTRLGRLPGLIGLLTLLIAI